MLNVSNNTNTKINIDEKMYLTALIIIIALTTQCKNNSKTEQDKSTGKVWADVFNQNIDEISEQYYKSAFILTSEGDTIKGKTGITSFHKNLKNSSGNITDFSVIAQQKVTKAPFIRYEIGTFSTTNGNKYKYLAIYETYNNTELRVFESIIQCSKNPANIRMLEQRRIDWANGASSHNVKSFINDLYASNALYYSQSNDKLSLGSKSIIETFAYMNDPRYTFDKLESIHSEPVNEEIILEIGIWKMPYISGEYVIIWKLCSDNVWRVLIDSNF